MKLKVLFFIFLKICIIYCKLFKTLTQRTKMNNLACDLSEKYEEISELEKKYVELSNSITESNDFINLSPMYNEFIELLKKDKEMANEFLILKMFYGDKIASRLYMDLSMQVESSVKSSNIELNEEDVIRRVREIASSTNGIGAKSFAQYQAIEYLKEYKLKDNKYRCDVNLEDENGNSNQGKLYRTETGVKYLGWNTIKYLKFPKNPNVRNSTYWNTKWNKFPGIVRYGNTKPKDCSYVQKASTYVDEINQVNLYDNCDIQIIGDHTTDTEKKEVIKVKIDGKPYNIKLYVSEKILDYNCLGWAIGIMDFLNPHIFSDPPRHVKTKQELKLYLKQFKEAMSTIKKEGDFRKLAVNNNSMNITDRTSILEKIKPAPSMISDLINKKGILETDNYIIGLNDDITDEQIAKVCRGNLKDAVIFYGGADGTLTHAARYSQELKTWTSKLGYSTLITHSLHLLDSIPGDISIYGAPKYVYCPNGVDNNIPGSAPKKTNFL